MKTLQYIFCVLTLSSCASIYFEEAMPTDAPDLALFPEELRGSYTSTVKRDLNHFEITATEIVEYDSVGLRKSFEEIAEDPDLELKDGFLHVGNEVAIIPVTILGDSVFGGTPTPLIYGSTKSARMCFRQYRDFIVWNKVEEGHWKIAFAELKDGQLLYWEVRDTDIIPKSVEVNMITTDDGAERKLIAPSKRQFKKIIRTVAEKEPSVFQKQ
jgi:hypothetical protein